MAPRTETFLPVAFIGDNSRFKVGSTDGDGLPTAVTADAVSSPVTVLEANLYQNNTSNGIGGNEQFAINLAATAPLFVDPTHNDFYPAEDSNTVPTPASVCAAFLYLLSAESRGIDGEYIEAQ